MWQPRGLQNKLCTLERGQKTAGVCDTWAPGAQVCQQQCPFLQELGNKTERVFFFLHKSPLSHFVSQSCSTPGFSKPFQAFFFSYTFWFFPIFCKSRPTSSLCDAFSVPSSLPLLFVFHNCLASCSFLPSSFLGLFAHPGLFLFLEGKNTEAHREVLHKIKSRVSIIVFLNSSELLHHTLK